MPAVRLAKHEGTADLLIRPPVQAIESGGSTLIRRMHTARAGRESKEVKIRGQSESWQNAAASARGELDSTTAEAAAADGLAHGEGNWSKHHPGK